MGSAETIMALSSTTVLAQMAKFLFFLSDAPSYWFSLDKSCDSEFHRMAAMVGTTIAMAADGETTIN